MSSGSPASSVAPGSSIAPSVESIGPAATRKKRTIAVVRRRGDRRPPGSSNDEYGGVPPTSPKKKTLLVARRPRASEGRLFEHETAPPRHAAAPGAMPGDRGVGGGTYRDSGGQFPSSMAVGKLQWLPDGRVLDKSVLGTAEAFEEMDAQLGWVDRPGGEEEDSLHPLQGTDSSVGSSPSLRSKQSFRSLRSKQSCRSLRSRDRQSTGDRGGNGRGSRPGTSPDGQSVLQREMERYMRRISEAEDTAIRNRAASARKEAKLMDHVGLTEKLTMQREGNSMRQWKRRQRDWDRVSRDMAAKTGKASCSKAIQ
ncbi:unnamed protein product [Ectocarpus fasciculatus]